MGFLCVIGLILGEFYSPVNPGRFSSRLITLLAGDLAGTLDQVETNAGGATDRMAKTMMQGVVGDWAAFVASIENLFLAIAESGVLKSATEAIKSMTNGLKWLSETNPRILEFSTYALLLGAALGPLGLLMRGVIGFFGTMRWLLSSIAASSAGAIAVLRAAAGIGGASAVSATGAAGAAGVAAGAGAATKGGGWVRKSLRRAGWVGLGLTAYDIADHLGYGFGGSGERVGPEATPEQGRAHDLAEWQARQAAIDARLAQIEKSMHPAMRDMPNVERDLLHTERAMIEQRIGGGQIMGDAAAGSAAATETMDGFNETMEIKADEARAIMAKLMADIQSMAATVMAPAIRPKMDMSGISGVHADVGVE